MSRHSQYLHQQINKNTEFKLAKFMGCLMSWILSQDFINVTAFNSFGSHSEFCKCSILQMIYDLDKQVVLQCQSPKRRQKKNIQDKSWDFEVLHKLCFMPSKIFKKLA